jgi:uncharacterized protein (DUF433 family)
MVNLRIWHYRRAGKLKIKEDIIEKFENDWTIYDIAEEYNCTVEAVMKMLDLQENIFSYELH